MRRYWDRLGSQGGGGGGREEEHQDGVRRRRSPSIEYIWEAGRIPTNQLKNKELDSWMSTRAR